MIITLTILFINILLISSFNWFLHNCTAPIDYSHLKVGNSRLALEAKEWDKMKKFKVIKSGCRKAA